MKISQERSLIPIYLFFVPLFFAFTSCKNSEKNISYESHIPTTKIDFYQYKRVDGNTKLQEHLPKPEYILLDSDSEDLLFRRIDKIKIWNNHFYILDARRSSLLVYDKEGKGVKKIGMRGEGPAEYLTLTEFDIDKEGNLYMIDPFRNSIHVYNSNGEFIRSTKTDFPPLAIKCLDNNQFLLYLNKKSLGFSSESTNQYAGEKIIKIDKDLTEPHFLISYNKEAGNYSLGKSSFSETDNGIFFQSDIENIVHEFSPITGEITHIYEFDFGKRNVPDKYKVNANDHLDQYDSFSVLKNFTVIKENMIFGYIWEGRQDKVFYLDKSTATCYFTASMNPADISRLTGYSEGKLITYYSPGAHEDLEKDELEKLPREVTNHLENEGFVLCLYDIN